MFLFKRGAQAVRLILTLHILCGLFFLPSFLSGRPESQTGKILDKNQNFRSSPAQLFLEGSWGRYEVSDSRYTEVYSGGNGIVTLAFHTFFKSVGRHSFGLTAGIKRFSKEGESTVTREDTRLILTSVFLAGEYILNLPPFYPGVEIGFDPCFYTEESLLATTKGSAAGYHIQGNLFFQPPRASFLRIKVYVRHSRIPARETFRVNLGGLEYGAGLLIKINPPWLSK